MLKDFDALIFDMDGTLIDSMGIWKQIDIDYLAMKNIPFPDDLQQCIEGMCFHDTAQYFKNRFKVEETVEELEKTWNDMAYYKYSHETKLKDGAFDFLTQAKKNGYKLGIATSNSKYLAEAVLKANGVYELFDTVLTGCDTKKSKPDPEIYLEASKLLDVPPNKCLVFEDVIPGIMAGKNAGMSVCAVDDFYSQYSINEKKALADMYIYSYNELIDKWEVNE